MPIFKDFAENGELLQTRDEPLNAQNLERYIKENGIDKASGYLEALKDILGDIDKILDVPSGKDAWYPNSAAVVRTQTRKLFEERSEFLKLGQQIVIEFNFDDASQSPQP